MTTQPVPNITPFSYEDHEVRVLDINGEPWFVLADLCKVLALSNPAVVAKRLDEADVSQTYISSGGQRRAMTIVAEPGLYDVVVRSDSPAAKPFRRWVTHEVLPTIRQRGGYLTPEAAEEALTDPDFIIRLATDLKRARAEREAMAAYARELEPKAANYDRFLSGDGTYSIGAVAKILGRSQNKLFDELRNAGILIAKGAMRNTPYQKYMHHFTVRAHDYTRSDGTVGTSYTTKVQPSGLAFIQAKLGVGQGVLI